MVSIKLSRFINKNNQGLLLECNDCQLIVRDSILFPNNLVKDGLYVITNNENNEITFIEELVYIRELIVNNFFQLNDFEKRLIIKYDQPLFAAIINKKYKREIDALLTEFTLEEKVKPLIQRIKVGYKTARRYKPGEDNLSYRYIRIYEPSEPFLAELLKGFEYDKGIYICYDLSFIKSFETTKQDEKDFEDELLKVSADLHQFYETNYSRDGHYNFLKKLINTHIIELISDIFQFEEQKFIDAWMYFSKTKQLVINVEHLINAIYIECLSTYNDSNNIFSIRAIKDNFSPLRRIKSVGVNKISINPQTITIGLVNHKKI